MPILAAFTVPHPPLIVPEVGRGGEAQITATTRAYEKAAEEIAALEPETIIISSPHYLAYTDYFRISAGKGASGSLAGFGAADVRFDEEYDTELVEKICSLADSCGLPAGTDGQSEPPLDHGTMVPLYFIRRRYKGGRIVRVGLSGLTPEEHYSLGIMISIAVNRLGRRAVFVASGDLSHKLQEYGPYGFAPEGPEYDRRIMDVLGRGAFDELFDFSDSFRSKAAECGHGSFTIMAGALDGMAVEANVYSHEDVTGVGYGVCGFRPLGEDSGRKFLDRRLEAIKAASRSIDENSDDYVKLARRSLESYILRHERIAVPDGLPEEMYSTRAGAFVSIHKSGQLRGCIGTIAPTQESVAAEIIENAISASTRDPRFSAITPEELPELEINVDVLGEPEFIDDRSMLDVKRYGVIVSNSYRRGLLLPDLEGVDTVEDQIDIARRKAGIGEYETITLQRFEVVRHR